MLSATQPDTAILYQLCQESGTLINVRDLLSAYQAVKGSSDDEKSHMYVSYKGKKTSRDFQDRTSQAGCARRLYPISHLDLLTLLTRFSSCSFFFPPFFFFSRFLFARRASFQQAFGELFYLGLLKRTRKRVDHVARGAWGGL